MNNYFLDTELGDYDLFGDDWDSDLEEDAFLEEGYDESEGQYYSPDFLPEYEADTFDDSAELAEVLREAIHEDYQDVSPEAMEEALFNIMDQMTPAEGFSFTNVLRDVGQGAQKAIKDPTTYQIAGALAGGLAGGAGGAKQGAEIGQVVGSVVAGKPLQAAAPTTAVLQPPANPPGLRASPNLGQAAVQAFSQEKKEQGTGSPSSIPVQASSQNASNASTSAAQLLVLMQTLAVRLGLLARALGDAGKNCIPIGKTGKCVTVPELLELISSLASEASAQTNKAASAQEDVPAYLLDRQGNYKVDPADTKARLQALYHMLLSGGNAALVGEDVPRRPWSDYIPFRKDTKLLIEYQTWIRDLNVGQGNILDRTPNLLKAKLHIDKWDRFNVPETFVTLMIEYIQEGPGNKALIVVNGQQYTDNNVTIRSGPTRDIFMSIEILGEKVKLISIKKDGDNRAKIKFVAQDDEHVLILTKD